MQRASQQSSATVRATLTKPLGASDPAGIILRLLEDPIVAHPPADEPLCEDEFGHRGPRQIALEKTIRERIEARLSGRVRNLTVRACGDLVVLEGQCATFYTKQLAQHAAMGVLNEEQLENAIVVNVPR